MNMETTVADKVYDFLNDACDVVNSICATPDVWKEKTEEEICELQLKFLEIGFITYQDSLDLELQDNCKICIDEYSGNFDMVFDYISKYYGEFFSLFRKMDMPPFELGREAKSFVWYVRSHVNNLVNESIERAEACLYQWNSYIANYPSGFLRFKIELNEGKRIEDIDEQRNYYEELLSKYSKIEGCTDRVKEIERKLMECSMSEGARQSSKIYLSDKATKIDIIRVFIALHGLGWFVQQNGQEITQKALFEELGIMYNRNELANYARDLSQLKSNEITEERNTKIFQEMSNVLLKKCRERRKS